MIKIILVPVDGSERSAAVLGTAEVIANRFGAHVKVVHVVIGALTFSGSMIAWGKSKSESRVTAEFYRCAIEVMRGAVPGSSDA